MSKKGGQKSKNEGIVVDTNVLIHDPNAIFKLREKGETLYIPYVVIQELDGLKSRPDIGFDANEVASKIEKIRQVKEPSLVVVSKIKFEGLEQLDPREPDDRIIATAQCVKNDMGRWHNRIVLVSRDKIMRLKAREILKDVEVEDYEKDSSKEAGPSLIKEINVSKEKLREDKNGNFFFFYQPLKHGDVEENGGIICYSDVYGSWDKAFVAIRKGDHCWVIPPDVRAFGISPLERNGDGPNWEQCLALWQLLDKEIKLVFLQGGAGTGKTLLAVAAGLEQLRDYRQIVIARPMVHLEDEDNVGYLKGDLEAKMAPWLKPLHQALGFLSEISEKNSKIIKDKLENQKITFESLDYIRGTTYRKTFLIIDEAQNLTPHQFKTIITRAGEGTKMVFTGDIGQIDRRRRLTSRSNGLTYSIDRLRGDILVGVTVFNKTVRSDLADLAERLL